MLAMVPQQDGWRVASWVLVTAPSARFSELEHRPSVTDQENARPPSTNPEVLATDCQ